MATVVKDNRDSTLRDLLADGLSKARGHEARITGIRRLDYWRSSHSFARLIVSLEGGEHLQVVAKRHRPGRKRYGNECEILTYERLLADRRFGAPAVYCSVYDESRRRFLLLLEDVGSETLNHADDGEWVQAVQGLANMHGSFLGREEELRRLGCLHDHDDTYYHDIISEARTNLAAAGTAAIRARFDGLLPRMAAVIQFLVDQPRTLVHGDLFPDNVILSPEHETRPIDWESAAIGVGAGDVIALIEGWTGPARARLMDAYQCSLEETLDRREQSDWPDTASQYRPLPIDRHSFGHLVQCCEILQWARYLAWDAEYCRDLATARELIDLVEGGLNRLDEDRTDG